MQRKTKTIIIEKKSKSGFITKVIYAKVTARLAELHKDNPKKARIVTEHFAIGELIGFKATVTPDTTNADVYFTGTSLGKIIEEKALEKLETLAVGRALAFAGYLADGEIASFEEMEKYDKQENKVIIDVSEAMKKLQDAKTLVELSKVYRSLSQDERNSEEVNTLKDELKASFGGVTEQKNENI